MVTAANLIARISIDGAESAEAKLLGVGSAAEETNAKISRLALGGVVIAGAALVGLGALSVKMAADFKQVMLQSEALANVSKRDGDAASAAILQMAAALGQTPLELGKGFYYIASTGASAKDSLIELALAAKAAAVGNTTTEVTANALTAILSTYGLKAKDAAKITDEMVASVSAGKTEFTDYAKVIGMVATNAKQAGVSFAEATSAFSALSNVMSPKQAKDAADALLQTTSRFTVLEDRAKSLGLAFDLNAYKSMNLEDRLKYLQKITGGNTEEIGKLLGRQNAMAAFTDLSANHFENYNNVLAQVLHSHGDLDTAFAKTSSGFNAAMGRMNAATQVLLITIGNMLLPGLTKLADAVTPMITAFTNWATSGHALSDVITYLNANTQTLVPILSGLGAMLLAIVVPAMVTLAGSVIAATWPFLAVGAAVGGLVALLLRFHPEITTVSGAFQMLGSTFQAVLPYIGYTATALAVFFTPAIIAAGVQALVSAGKIAFNFVASLIASGFEGWAAAFKIAAYVAALIATGVQAAVAGAIIAGKFVVGLVTTAIQAGITASTLYAGIIPALYATGVAATVALGPIGLIIAAVGLATVAFAAMKHQSDVMNLGVSGAFDTMGNKVQRSTGRIIATADQMKQSTSRSANEMQVAISNSIATAVKSTQSGFDTMNFWVRKDSGELSDTAKRIFGQLVKDVNGDWSQLDQDTKDYWNGIAAYIDNKSGLAAAAANYNFSLIHMPDLTGAQAGTLLHFAGNAEGTDYWRGGPTWVGEKGPELLNLPRGAQIIPNNRIGGIGGGGPIHVHVTVNPELKLDGYRVTKQLMPHMAHILHDSMGTRF